MPNNARTKKTSMTSEPIQELAFYRAQYQINGKSFYCSQACYQGELMNGIELKVKEVKGLQNNLDKVDYLSQSQQIVFSSGSNIITYNAHKRSYHKLIQIKNTLEMLRSHIEKKNGKEYILWIQKKEITAERDHQKVQHANSIVTMQKETKNQNEKKPQNERKVTFGNIFGAFIQGLANKGKQGKQEKQGKQGKQDENNENQKMDASIVNNVNHDQPSIKQIKSIKSIATKTKKTIRIQQIPKNYRYIFKIYDFTKKQMLYKYTITMKSHWKIKDIFLFHNAYKYVGYIYQDQNQRSTYISYQNLQEYSFKDEQLRHSTTINFFQVEPYKTIPCNNFEGQIKYNSELGSFIFSHKKAIYSINLCYQNNATLTNTQKLLQLTDNSYIRKPTIVNPLKLTQSQKHSQLNIVLGTFLIMSVDTPILNFTLNEQYLAVLTSKSIEVYSAFEMDQLVISYDMKNDIASKILPQPSFIEFNKGTILLAHKNSPKISTFAIKANQLKLQGTTELEINQCKEILKIFANSLSTEIICISRLYELEGRMSSIIKSRKIVQNTFQYIIKPACIDLNISYVSSSSKSEAKTLGINCQPFKRILTCPWLSSYLIQTDDQIQSSNWKESFENKKCSVLHPTGLYLIICFKECFKIYLLTIEGLVNTYQGDNLKDIQSAAINHEGNTFAVASSNFICIYNFYQCKKIATINLSVGCLVERIQYKSGQLVSHLKNKKIYIYNSYDYKQIYSFNPKGYITQSHSNGEESNIFQMILEVAAPSIELISDMWYDNELSVIIMSYKTSLFFVNIATNTLICNYQFGYAVTCFYYNKNLSTLFLGTQSGEVLSFAWPNKPTKFLSQHISYKCHRKRIIDIKVTADLKELISVSDDQSIYISSLTYVVNLKKMEGLEIVEHRENQIQICFDFLYRKGFSLYTHSQLTEKIDLVKDYEDEILNINFIMPEERIKQKEAMLSNVESTHDNLSLENQQHFEALSALSSKIRSEINQRRQDLRLFAIESDKQRQSLIQQQYKAYLQLYESNKQLQFRKKEMKESHQMERSRLRQLYQKEKQNTLDQYEYHIKNVQKNQNITPIQPYHEIQESDLIDEENKAYVTNTLETLSKMIADLSLQNGVLLCKNNKTIKDIQSFKHKIEENKSLIYSIEMSLKGLKTDQLKFETTKEYQNKMLAQEDQVNLSAIQRKYVKQTKQIIEKDIEINNKIVRYEKEKDMLVHLQKSVEAIQEEIKNLVNNMLCEREDIRPELIRLEEGSNKLNKLLIQKYQRIRQSKQSATHLKISMSKLLKIISNTNEDSHDKDQKHQSSKAKLMNKLMQANLLPQQKTFKQEIDMNRTNGFRNTSGFDFYEKKMVSTARKLETEPRESFKEHLSSRNNIVYRSKFKNLKENFQKKASKILFHQSSEEKCYQRIKTEQIVYENSRKKFTTENQDLISTFNTLAHQNKMLRFLMTKKENDFRDPSRKLQRESKKKSTKPTPFMQYINNKTIKMKTLPCASYQY